ncbi:MAG: hypothetical protein H6659_12395 [Ardenticatenaceae bacterium]|nr:hypothetical protein [Ardenticatenaceae bacterium]
MTKRQLGYAFIALGLLAAVGSFVNDMLGAGEFQGVGPTQRLALLAAGAIILVGVSLLPLGDRPA